MAPPHAPNWWCRKCGTNRWVASDTDRFPAESPSGTVLASVRWPSTGTSQSPSTALPWWTKFWNRITPHQSH
jgi:hypothetical protein